MANPSEPEKYMMSAQIDLSIWEAFNKRASNGLETKRSHLERALLAYIGPEYFDNPEDYRRLAEKYNIESSTN